ncbi:cation diffusion facilitator family transporter [Dermatophilus congolensis]|uniref:cation diffusion facilitator family transporter n=1 Tax=Dermatophilus congolensis TaxID=1863 RepID=UPI0004837534|nr:cation diffusion facilitator family transporter [Dermatophilus congolensis]MBO3129391.1 cation transporter [Dermatophilus congolensis]MBO3131976.1 cation transporter [Dermatophilus congolensis]MBO3133868.1 cation transporter [Dermatophilus congolensis]MBO3136098.1 cation transporter [Dermatophilus congolensis]MBO3138342.1 cation transporter [Dermatophilus congolensis]
MNSSASGPAPHPGTAVDLTKFAWLSIAAALGTMALKIVAWWMTGSVGLLSDALESSVNLVAAIIALISLRAAAMPADANHHYGHSKAEYFSAAVEGIMIFVAATAICFTAIQRLLDPKPLDNVGPALAISLVAGVLNGAVALVLIRAGKTHRSLTLTADGRHLMTDVWTSIGVVVGVALVLITGWEILDPIVALAVGINIIITGWKLIKESIDGLMDVSWPKEENTRLAEIVAGLTPEPTAAHALRTRESGQQRFTSMHLLVPGTWTVKRSHDLAEEIEKAIRAEFGEVSISIHIEPSEDPRSYDDYEHEVAIPTEPTP